MRTTWRSLVPGLFLCDMVYGDRMSVVAPFLENSKPKDTSVRSVNCVALDRQRTQPPPLETAATYDVAVKIELGRLS